MAVEIIPALDLEVENVYNRIVAQTRREHRLFSVHWELTYRCNQRCSHCYLDMLPPRASVPGELTTAECLRVVDELADLGVLNLTFSGGEILARDDFFAIAEHTRARRFLIRLFTNGALIDPKVADRIAVLHPYAVEISIYSTVAERHEAITGRPGSFALSMRAFDLLRQRGVRTVLKTPLMRENVRELDALETRAGELGARFRYDTTITPRDDGSLAPLKHRLAYDDLLWLFRHTLKVEEWVDRSAPLDGCTCAVGSNALAIDPLGNVSPCVQARLSAGNLLSRSLREIWEESPVWRELACLTRGELPVCRGCELRTLCRRCHGLAQLEDGDLRGPAYANCREALARRQVLVEKGALPPDYPIPEHFGNWSIERK